MNPINPTADRSLRRGLIVLLALALIATGLDAKERRGAKVSVTKLDKSVVEGELLAVKGNDLTILVLSSATEVTVDLFEVKEIFFARPSKMIASAVLGALAFGVPAAIYGAKNGKGGPILLGGLAAVGGGLTGLLVAGMSDSVSVDMLDGESLTHIKARLKKHARYRT